MCGVVGYIGGKVVDKQLVEILKNLEYRGYDSAGVAVMTNVGIEINKKEGKITNLDSNLKNNKNAMMGIAHTRWATHGKPSEVNAHPHISSDKKWAVVHNGIIENFGELKKEIEENKEIKFVSQTDTEVVPQFLQYMFDGNILSSFIKVCNKLSGSYALLMMNEDDKENLYLAKNKSPLYVAKGENEIFVASDPICFVGKAENYYMFEDGEFAVANLNEIVFYNEHKEKIIKQPIKLTLYESSFGKNDYPHYMLKEINEVPQVLRRIADTYTDSKPFEKIDNSLLNKINRIVFVGCGTAYHAGLMGANMIEKFARIDSRTYVASEFRYSDPIIDEKTLAIFVSQSGETADTISAHDLAKNRGATTIALTNVLYSTLAKKADYILPVCAGPEIAVASTKAYTAQITILYMLAKYLDGIKKNKDTDYISNVFKLSREIIMPNELKFKDIIDDLAKEKNAFFIGRGLDYVTSEEASLKLKEITYINSQAYPSGELKHGFLALVENGTYVFVLATQKELLDKTLNGAHEASARGGKLIIATQYDIPEEKLKGVYSTIKLQKFDDELMPIVSIGAFQMISYLTSIKKCINPDQPRNLAKSVTVE